MSIVFKKNFKQYTLLFRKKEKRGYFIHIPKSAGSSLRHFCRSYNIEIIGHNARNKNYVWFKDYHDRSKYFSFAFVRDPLDRAISAFYFLSNGGMGKKDRKDIEDYILNYDYDFNSFVRNEMTKVDVTKQIHFIPQYKWITDDNGEICVDFVGKVENIASDFQKLVRFLDFGDYELKMRNKNIYKPSKFSLSDDSIEIIKDIYAMDYDLFGY